MNLLQVFLAFFGLRFKPFVFVQCQPQTFTDGLSKQRSRDIATGGQTYS
jgi:hypothetical protein